MVFDGFNDFLIVFDDLLMGLMGFDGFLCYQEPSKTIENNQNPLNPSKHHQKQLKKHQKQLKNHQKAIKNS